MVHWLPVELVIVGHRGRVLLFLLELQHLLLIDICLEVMEAWHQSPRNLQVRQCFSEGLVVLLPEFGPEAVPGLATDDVPRDRNEVRLLLCNQRPDHRESLVIQVRLANLTEMQICQLHDPEVVVRVHLQV